MSNHEPGDRLVSPYTGAVWLYIGELDGYSYLRREGGDAGDRVEGFGNIHEWEPAPEPSFKEGKGYRHKNSRREFLADRVVDTSMGARVFLVGGDSAFVVSAELRDQYEEI